MRSQNTCRTLKYSFFSLPYIIPGIIINNIDGKGGAGIHSILYVEINCFALSVLLLIFFNTYKRGEPHTIQQRIFFALIITAALILVLDSGMWIVDGMPGAAAKAANILITSVYYILNPMIPMIWYFYVDYHIFRSGRRLARLLPPMLLPFAVNFVLTVMSVFGNVLFYIDGNNVYNRGRYFLIVGLVCLYYFAHTMVLILSMRRKINENEYMPLLFFALPPTIAALIQNFNYGLSLIWIAVTFSILVIFINIQNDRLYRDYLTNLYNRRQLDNYLAAKSQSGGKLLGGMMIDIDCFKAINDVYGHKNGDEALKQVAELLRRTFGKNDFIARYGGDEFVLFTEIHDKSELADMAGKLTENLAQLNARRLSPYEISLSIGWDAYPSEKANCLMDRIDTLMYENKQRAKMPEKEGEKR